MTKYRYAQRKGKYVGKIYEFLDGLRLNNLIRRTVRLCDANRGIEIDTREDRSEKRIKTNGVEKVGVDLKCQTLDGVNASSTRNRNLTRDNRIRNSITIHFYTFSRGTKRQFLRSFVSSVACI